MNLTTLITELRGATTSFGVSPEVPRVAGSAEFVILPEAANLIVPAAYVVPLTDDPQEQESKNGYSQDVRDTFGVIVVFSNRPDERGQVAINGVHAMRAELWGALLGLVVPGDHGDYGPMTYEGGVLIHRDRARLYYQYEFSAVYHIDSSDTRQGRDLAAAPAFLEMDLNLKGAVPHSTDVPDQPAQKVQPPQ